MELPKHIAERIRHIVATTSHVGAHIDNEAARYGGVALMGTIGAVWFLRPDGTFWSVDDEFGCPLIPLAAEWHHKALQCGATRYSWLAELVPPRPAGALPCATCRGGGEIPVAGSSDGGGVFCNECHARGWHPPNENA